VLGHLAIRGVPVGGFCLARREARKDPGGEELRLARRLREPIRHRLEEIAPQRGVERIGHIEGDQYGHRIALAQDEILCVERRGEPLDLEGYDMLPLPCGDCHSATQPYLGEYRRLLPHCESCGREQWEDVSDDDRRYFSRYQLREETRPYEGGCGREVTNTTYASRRWVTACSERCSAKALRRMRREHRRATCETCGETFTPTRSDSRYCSPACRQKAYRERKSEGAA
jgi:hypothetical protein